MLNQIPAAAMIEAAADQLRHDQEHHPEEEVRELMRCAKEMHVANFRPASIEEAYYFGLRVAATMNDLSGPAATIRNRPEQP
jgi:hypothetical protein